MPTGSEEYYAQRAAEYDLVYEKPERQGDIAALGRSLTQAFAGRDVLDIAAGTGFWTERFADGARSTTVCDVNEETLLVARSRRTWTDTVTFACCDAFALDDVPGAFDAAFIGFLWSHVDVDDLDRFLDGVIQRLEPGATVVIADNIYVDGSNHRVTRTDESGNTYQRRGLADGSEWEVRKNFPPPEEVAARLARHGVVATITSMTYFWTATFRTPRDREASGGECYDEAVTAAYLAHRHSGTASPNIVMEEPAVLAQLGDLSDLRVVDLGCGDGSFADVVLDGGAHSYLGLDGSAAMIDLARKRVRDPRVTFQLGSIEDFVAAPGSADLVTSRMAFHHLREVGPALRSVHRTLTPGGRLIFTVAHPVITSHDDQAPRPRTSWTVDDYFETGPRRRSWFGSEVTWFHRTVEQYLSAVLATGFDLEAVSECEPDGDLLADAPEELARRRRVPLVLLISARRR